MAYSTSTAPSLKRTVAAAPSKSLIICWSSGGISSDEVVSPAESEDSLKQASISSGVVASVRQSSSNPMGASSEDHGPLGTPPRPLMPAASSMYFAADLATYIDMKPSSPASPVHSPKAGSAASVPSS